jgi:hypothetical protein
MTRELPSLRLAARAAQPAPPALQFKVELDERCILLPDGKIVQHLLIYQDEKRHVALDGIFAFNVSERPARLLLLTPDEARSLASELVAAVYAAKTGFVFLEALKISIVVVPNGYRLEIAGHGQPFELYLSTGVIWRVIRGLLSMLDAATPIVTN